MDFKRTSTRSIQAYFIEYTNIHNDIISFQANDEKFSLPGPNRYSTN